MKFYSTNNESIRISFSQAVLKGAADDGGLFMPAEIPQLNKNFFNELSNLNIKEIAFEVIKNFIDDIPRKYLIKIIDDAITFEAPIVQLNENLYVLELFHGPTLAFKDFGAQFLAKTISYLIQNQKKETIILVATSGDTGSAVASGFHNLEGIKVGLLYPKNKVSKIQEQQLTTFDNNIFAFEVNGNFDDCQRLVKQAFADNELKNKFNLTSANSINIARLLPQTFYYFSAYSQLKRKNIPLIFSVPSGNFGNLTAGLIANEMGLPIYKFIAALNLNDVFLKYLRTGIFHSQPTIQTYSNAMDVGNPSNVVRIFSLYKNYEKIKENISAFSFSDDETLSGIKEVYEKYNYIFDPHGAIGYLALKEFLNSFQNKNINGIILETAHPSKFKDIVEKAINNNINLPERLKFFLQKEKKSIPISNDFRNFKEVLLNTF
ncbi:MAG: threonine synthase [Ignavibacterium sp.]